MTKIERDNPYQAPQSDTRLEVAENFKELSYKQLKSLRNHSHSIRALNVVWFIGGLFAIYSVFMTFAGSQVNMSNITAWQLYGVIFSILLITSITLTWRPNYSRWIGIILCVLSLFLIPLGTLLGGLGLIAFINGAALFGEHKLKHAELESEYRHRKKHKIFD